MNNVCAVIVTFNRKELLLRNINSLLKQVYPVDILIYDNASTDGTFQYLQENKIIEKTNVQYYLAESNTGGSGGFCFGAQIAVKKGYDYIWLMDDDGYCIDEFTLEKLMSHVDGQRVIWSSYVTHDLDSKEATFPLLGRQNRNELETLADENQLIGTGSPYNGTLVPRRCFEEVGYNDARYFVYGDENEFFMRTKQAGYDWITIMDSFYYHPINRNVLWEFHIGKYGLDCKNQPVWKFYLEMRNREYNYIKFNKKKRFSSYVKAIIIALFSKDKRVARIKYGVMGIKDARKDNFDRPIMFNV